MQVEFWHSLSAALQGRLKRKICHSDLQNRAAFSTQHFSVCCHEAAHSLVVLCWENNCHLGCHVLLSSVSWGRLLASSFLFLHIPPRPLHSLSFLVSNLNQMPAKPLGPLEKVPVTPFLLAGPLRQAYAPSGSCQGPFNPNTLHFALLSIFFLVFLIQLITLS